MPGAAAFEERARLIIDTDMSIDVDDVLALGVAHKLQDLGHVELLAIMHNTGLPEGVGAVASVNAFYGRADLPVGAFKGTFGNPTAEENRLDRWLAVYGRGPYVSKIVQQFPTEIQTNSQVPDAVDVYRRVLAESPDASVVIVSIGFLGNLAALLASPPDDSSALSGADLVGNKVRELVIMGGRYPSSRVMHYQWYFGGGCAWGSMSCPETPTWTKSVVDGWPEFVPVTFVGHEIGHSVQTAGGQIGACAAERTPGSVALELSAKVGAAVSQGAGADTVAVLYAALGLQKWGERHRGGVNSVSAEDGANTWVDGPLTHQSYVTLLPSQRKALADEISKVVCLAPSPLVV